MDFSGISTRQDRWVYEQVAGVIKEAIKSGELRPREMLPSEQEIVYRAGVSRWTARKAIALLRDKGLVYSRAHMGSFVAERKDEP